MATLAGAAVLVRIVALRVRWSSSGGRTRSSRGGSIRRESIQVRVVAAAGRRVATLVRRVEWSVAERSRKETQGKQGKKRNGREGKGKQRERRRKGTDGKGKERKGKERKGKEKKGKERKQKERKGQGQGIRKEKGNREGRAFARSIAHGHK